jgi:hypothetical protein
MNKKSKSEEPPSKITPAFNKYRPETARPEQPKVVHGAKKTPKPRVKSQLKEAVRTIPKIPK